MAKTTPQKTIQWSDSRFLEDVERRSGTPIGACLQCHKCSTGCPVRPDVDFSPSQIMRLIQLGEEDETLGSQAIWFCASCEACTTRCPMEIDIAAVMDTLRIMAIERNASLGDKRGSKFNLSFLSSVKRNGRVFEVGMLTAYKLRSGDLFSDVLKFPQMLMKGKISLLPKRSGDAKQMQQLFERAEEEEEKRQ